MDRIVTGFIRVQKKQPQSLDMSRSKYSAEMGQGNRTEFAFWSRVEDRKIFSQLFLNVVKFTRVSGFTLTPKLVVSCVVVTLEY